MRESQPELDTRDGDVCSEVSSYTALCKEFDPHTAAKLVEFGIEAWFAPGKFLFREHDESGQFYFITLGSVAVEQPCPSRTTRIKTLHEGDFLGWSALLGSGTRRFDARATTEVAAIAFDGALLRKTCEDDPRFGYALMKRLLLIVTERLDMVSARLTCVQEGRTS